MKKSFLKSFFFKDEKVVTTNTLTEKEDKSPTKEKNKAYSQEILQIHEEFMTASDRLFEQANEVINNIDEKKLVKLIEMVDTKAICKPC